MRLRTLHLKRYGHFTDRAIHLPPGQPDLHVIFGPNEAGKSTTLAAIEDLLFGIPSRSKHNFLHDYRNLLVGAVLERGDDTLELYRRKGNRQTLLAADGSPLHSHQEQLLASWRATADRPFFERMFSLDGQRLQQGGRDILEARDEGVGQQLFAASAGLHGLPQLFRALSAEADELWSRRPARHRKFYQAREQLKAANQTLHEQTVTARTWQELRDRHKAAEAACEQVNTALAKATTRHQRLSRIRRVLGDVQRKQELEAQLQALGQVVALPADAATTLETAERDDQLKATRITSLAEQRTRLQEELKGIVVDQTLLRRREAIRWCHERCIRMRAARAELPERQAEYHAADLNLRQLAAELEWSDHELSERLQHLPTRTRLRAARQQLQQAGRLNANVDNAAAACSDQEARQKQLQQTLQHLGNPVDARPLADAIRVVERRGDVAGRVRTAEMAVKGAAERLAQERQALHPAVDDLQVLMAMPVPPRAAVEDVQQQQQDWRRREQAAQQERLRIEQEQERVVAEQQRLLQDERIVTAKQLQAARDDRDGLWQKVKARYVQHRLMPDADPGALATDADGCAAALEPAIARADQLADRRFAMARAAAQVAELERQTAENALLLQQNTATRTALTAAGRALEARWAATWAATGVQPRDPAVMLAWLDRRTSVLHARDGHAEARATRTSALQEEAEARELLLAALECVGVDRAPLVTVALPLLLEQAVAERNRLADARQRQQQVAAELKAAAVETQRLNQVLQAARQALAAWQRQWRQTIGGLGLAATATTELIAARIDTIEQLGEQKSSLVALKVNQIDRISSAITAFEQEARQLLADVAPDLADQPVDDAVPRLADRLGAAERMVTLQQEKEQEVQRLSRQMATLENEWRLSEAAVATLRRRAGVETSSALHTAISRSDQQRAWQQEWQQLVEQLQRQGDGLTVKDLEQECAEIDRDAAAAREAELQQSIKTLQQQLGDQAEQRAQARNAFAAVGGDDGAARAAAERQAALCTMEAVASRYVQTKLAAMVLQWAMDRYRSEKQAPLLQRAGALFAGLTRQSFAGLQVQYDDRDQAELTGQRSTGGTVPVAGMSTGSADQLYLALRMAAVEDYIQRTGPLPFVADDLFVHFDNDRAAAGFQLLSELATTTQVLFFTHHQHLVDLAVATLGPDVSRVNLAP